MNKNSKYRPFMDAIELRMAQNNLTLQQFYQFVMCQLDECEAAEAALNQTISELKFNLQEHSRLHAELNSILHSDSDAPEAPSLCDLVNYVRSDRQEMTSNLDQMKMQVSDAFGDGYYDGFIDGAKHHEVTDCNTHQDYLGDHAMSCSEIAEGNKSKRLGILSRTEVAAKAVIDFSEHTLNNWVQVTGRPNVNCWNEFTTNYLVGMVGENPVDAAAKDSISFPAPSMPDQQSLNRSTVILMGMVDQLKLSANRTNLSFKDRATIASAVKLGCLSPEDAAALRKERDQWCEKADLVWQLYQACYGVPYAKSLAQFACEVAERTIQSFMSEAAHEVANTYKSSDPISQWETGANAVLAAFVRYETKYIAQLRAKVETK